MNHAAHDCAPRRGPRLAGLFWIASQPFLLASGAATQEPPEAVPEPAAEGQVVVYEPDFFARYNPVTALDMVRQVPGFKLESTSPFGNQPDVRGFGAAAVNVLINGKRPSSKSDSMEDLLARIGAGEVLRLELIRGGTGAGDRDITQGSVVLDVVLDQGTGGRDPAPWEAALHHEDGSPSLLGEVAVGTRRGNTHYLLGLKRNAYDWNLKGAERFSSATRAGELRDEVFFREGDELNLDLKSDTRFPGGDTLRFNLKGETGRNDESEVSNRLIETGGTDLFLRSDTSDRDEFELGADYEHDLSGSVSLKLIALARRSREDGESGLDITRDDGALESSRSPRTSESGETIGRIELEWSGRPRHTLKLGGEAVDNFVDSASELFVDTGSGPVAIDVEGSDTRVVERRTEVFVTDSWVAAEKVIVDLGFAYELSEISQSGDVGNSRSFTYPKPSISLAYSPSAVSQWRLRLERQVSQLDFFDFVSSSNFEDLDLDFGNPDLRPERTWHLESTHERRFGDIGVVEIELFYDRIDDVEDLLPVGEGFEIVGNIGDGRRSGGGIDITVPLGFLGLGDSRADISYRLQESSVTDPVNGLARELSGESEQTLEASLRKELPKRRAAVGVDYNWSSPRRSFGFDEVVFETQRSHLNVYVEARLWKQTKLRLEAFNLIDDPRIRRRTVFDGTRLSDSVRFEENRGRVDSQWFRLTLSGLF